jgi:hypothetical protein
VSILSRFAVNRHLDDSALAEIWSTAAFEGRGAAHPHLSACSECRARLDAFSEWLDDLRVEARVEADEMLTSERLAAQQSAIFRRLEAMERPARVIAFPKNTRPVTGSHRVTHRWVATAAAAGLVIGIATGQLVDLKKALDRSTSQPAPQITGTTASAARAQQGSRAQQQVQPANLAADEAIFYGEADSPVQSARYLPAVDELVPRARDDFDRN